MLITDHFVLINLPKTGTTFTRHAIKTVYSNSDSHLHRIAERLKLVKPRVTELMLPKIDEARQKGILDQHGTWRQIPKAFQTRPVVSILRNPFSFRLSNYHFRWWASNPPADPVEILKIFPSFPDLSFQEYLDLVFGIGLKNRLKDILPPYPIGPASIQFIQFFAKDPDFILRNINGAYFSQKSYITDFEHVHFLRHEKLLNDLKKFLAQCGFTPGQLSILNLLPPLNVTLTDETRKNALLWYSEESIEKMIKSERLIFSLFPEYLPNDYQNFRWD